MFVLTHSEALTRCSSPYATLRPLVSQPARRCRRAANDQAAVTGPPLPWAHQFTIQSSCVTRDPESFTGFNFSVRV